MLINWEAAVLLGQRDGRLPEFEGMILEKGHLIGGRTIGKMGVDLLTHHVYDFFKKNMQHFFVSIPVTDQAAQSIVYKSCLILNKEYTDEDHMVFEVQATEAIKNKLKLYVIGETVVAPNSQEVS